MITPEILAAVRAHIRANYDKSYGWQQLEESFTDPELAELIDQDGECSSIRDSIRYLRDYVRMVDEQYRAAQNEVF